MRRTKIRKRRGRQITTNGNTMELQKGEYHAAKPSSSSCSSSAPASNGEQQLNPLVAKLLRGESLPMSPQSTPLIRRFSEAKARGPEHYVEQIQICVANPGRFLASWTLLVTLFGEAKLYDFVRDARWSEEDLKRFVIKEDDYC